MHKPTIHCKTSKSSFFLHHPLTELLLTTTMFFFFPYDLLFSGYTTVSVIQLKMYISRNVYFQLRNWKWTLLILLIVQELIASFSINTYKVRGPNFARRCVEEGRCHLWHTCKCKIDELHLVCYFGPYWNFTFCGEWSVYAQMVTYMDCSKWRETRVTQINYKCKQ